LTALLAAAATVAVVDGLTKYLVTTWLVEGHLYGVGGAWGLRRIHNERGALTGIPVGYTALLWLATSVLAVMVVRLSPGSTGVAVGLGAVIGGTTGNLLDRLRRGWVVDFVSAGAWPVFNVADAAMVVGFVVALGAAV